MVITQRPSSMEAVLGHSPDSPPPDIPQTPARRDTNTEQVSGNEGQRTANLRTGLYKRRGLSAETFARVQLFSDCWGAMAGAVGGRLSAPQGHPSA
ncbi:hypothetical protein J6590_001372 [Homalodisca vitripennis]|nr:hypothetical protein J6590_001372 [Homalodisca vitripennis]